MDNNSRYNSFLDKLERDMRENEQESQVLYEGWRNNNRLSDLELAMFMSDKLDNITKIMQESDRLRSRDGKISRITIAETKDNSENAELRKEIDDLKDDIKELKELLINKLN